MAESWITSALDERCVEKAIVLASSLRRVRTAKKLVVITTSDISEKSREKLKEIFDLVLPLNARTPNGWNLEDYAKIYGWSLVIFEKCVYLSPNALVLRNCDEIFDKYANFAAAQVGEENEVDPSIYIFTPSLECSKIFGKISDATSGKLNILLQNQFPNWERLDEKFNFRLELGGDVPQSFITNASIVNFVGVHPLDCLEKFTAKTSDENSADEKFLVDYIREIYMDAVKRSPINSKLPSLNNQNKYKTEPIAIVGMSFRLPGGNNPEEFWSLLKEGRNAVIPVPEHRWTKQHSYYVCKDRKMEIGFVNVPVDEFDYKFFGLSPKEAEYLDPQQRLLMEVTWEALEDAMIDPLSLRGSQTGIYVGSWIHHYKTICRASVDVDFFRTYMGNSMATTTARLSHFFETTGPSVSTESGCSSAIAALDMACKSLRNRNSDLAIAAGVNLIFHPFEEGVIEFVASPQYRCKTFDADADGFARAEGCASFVIKRLSDAVRDGDKIWGLIRGTALSQEGLTKSMGTPTIHSESLAMELALKDACVDPKDVSYIEAHGTGTPVGDPLEISSICKVYSKGRTDTLTIGSVKTNVGHTESVSGLTGIIKVVLSMQNELIPKHLNFKTLNPQINLEAIPAQIPVEPVPWPKNMKKQRIAGVSSFGISGTDGHAIIEEPPQILKLQVEYNQERPLHIMKLSAKSSESFEELVKKYQHIFQEKIETGEDSEKDFANIAYSANIGRATFNHRAVIIAKNIKEAANILEGKTFKQAEVQSTTQNICFLFTGQGSQYPGMGKQLYETSPVFRHHFDKCDNLLRRKFNISIKNVLWPSGGNSEDLSGTLYSQTSIFVVEYCLLKLWESWGIKPDYVVGHSLGEFAAAVAAGALNFEDALMLVAERSRLIDNLPRGKMLVIKADKKTVDKTISEFRKINPNFWVDYAALNSSDQTVVAGDSGMVEEFKKFCTQMSLKTIILAATHAFHSRHMEPMLDAYRRAASTVKKPEVKEGSPKYISGMEGKLMDIQEIDADYWVRHTREKVSFIDACKAIEDEGCTLFLEVGPHPVLSAMVMMNMERISHQIKCLPSIRRTEEEWVTMLDTLSNLYMSDWKGEINWKGFDQFYTREKVKLPFYPFNRKPIWANFERIYPKIHPLIGSIVPCALGSTIFQSSLTLKNTSWVQDHVIGNTMIFPGAGYIEMCLAAGHSTIQGFTDDLVKPKRPVLLKSLKISSPLALHESNVCKLQTIVALNDNADGNSDVDYAIQIHRQEENEDGLCKWIQHVSAKYAIPAAAEGTLQQVPIQNIKSTWEKVSNTKKFYEMLLHQGLKFGPKFQSLQSAWKNENGLLTSIRIPEDQGDFIIHPILIDAMLQTVLMFTSEEELKKRLLVPIHIGEFLRLKDTSNLKNIYAYTSYLNNELFCTLLDEDGNPLAHMRSLDFVATTAKLVESMTTQQTCALPNLWNDVWRPCPGPMQGCLEHPIPPEGQRYSDEDMKYFEEKNKLPEKDAKHYMNLVNISRLSILKAFYTLGWKPKKGDIFSVDFLMKSFKIKETSTYRQYIRFYLRNMTLKDCDLSDYGQLIAIDEDENTFQFLKSPPTIEEIDEGLKHINNPDDVLKEDYKLVKEVSNQLVQILIGEVDPLAILFPEKEDKSKPSAAKLYDQLVSDTIDPRHFKKIDIHRLNSKQLDSKSTYRCLEIGAGTATFTEYILSSMMTNKNWGNMELEYYFTDVSAAFFSSAEKILKPYLKSLVFRKFDMEIDPLEQGFYPGYFDMITANEVLHISKDLRKTMRSVRSLMKSGGLLHIIETVNPDTRNTFMFGLLDGFWRFEDRELRRNHVSLSKEVWERLLNQSGFNGFTIVPIHDNLTGVMSCYAVPKENNFLKDLYPQKNSWIIFGERDDFTRNLQRKFENVNRKCLIVPKPEQDEIDETTIQKYFQKQISAVLEEGVLEGVLYLWSLSPKTRDQSKVSLPFLTLMKLVSQLGTPPKIFPVVRGAHAMDSDYDIVDPTPGTIPGFCKTLMNENTSLNLNCFDLDPNKDLGEQSEELFMNLWVDHHSMGTSTAFRDGLRLRPKLAKGKMLGGEPLQLPSGCDRFHLVLPKTKLISDLSFTYLETYKLEDGEVEVQVKASGLNFRDLLAVFKPVDILDEVNLIGLDISGVVIRVGRNVKNFKVGDPVLGMNVSENLSLASHIKVPENRIIPLPENMTFAEGASIPVIYTTVLYCLVKVAQMKKGETVLVHTASGGVGLAAIQLCKHIGANVIATAGSQKKRAYLRNLGIQHVFNSRTLHYKENILEVTGGRGVDIVLNSITGPGFKEASLAALGKGGRFIEMSKMNVWTREEVRVLRPDVSYEIVDVSNLEPEEYSSINHDLQNLLKSGAIKPIRNERYDALNIRDALTRLKQAKHIGKIVCIMPEVKVEKSRFITSTPLFNSVSTYVVTGGLGGLGFEVVKWYLRNGAKHIVILSRSSPSEEMASQIEKLNKAGHHVQAFSVDVGDFEKLKSVFEDFPKHGYPQVKGVMHSAGLLMDGILQNQTWDSFRHTYKPKVDGSWNLHELTKDNQLEHFVMFSSMTSILGCPGQGNHSASNSFQDSLALYRNSIGLPGTSINWGNWGEVGAAIEKDFLGLRPISTTEGLNVLEMCLRTHTNHIAVMNVESFSLMTKQFPILKSYLDDTRLLADSGPTAKLSYDGLWDEVDSTPDRLGKISCFKKFVKTVVRNILKMDVDDAIGDLTEFQTLGIDSLMMLEMKNSLQNVLSTRVTLTANQLKECSHTEALAEKLLNLLEGMQEDEESIPCDEEFRQLIREDSALLPETISTENKEIVSIDKVQTVLMTGVTGNLGPYLLKELTKRPQIKKIYCLIRPFGKISCMDRLMSKLEQLKMTELIDSDKIEVIEGDLASPKFGLEDEVYESLCHSVDAIVHNAVKSDHVSHYLKVPDTRKNDVRTVNVIGTLRVLEFAAEKKVKQCFYSSSIFAYTRTGKFGPSQSQSGWQDVSAFDSLKSSRCAGYVLSKHIAEQIFYDAIVKGVPCKAFRFPFITGDSKTGRVAYLHNHSLLRWMASMKLGAFHDVPYPVLGLPVDHCAKVGLDIFFNPDAPNDVYNVVTEETPTEQVILEVAKSFGVDMKTVSYEEFMELLRSDENSPLAPFRKAYEENASEFIGFENPAVQGLKKYFENRENCIDALRLMKYAPDFGNLVEPLSEMLIRDFKFLKEEGVFKKFGIHV